MARGPIHLTKAEVRVLEQTSSNKPFCEVLLDSEERALASANAKLKAYMAERNWPDYEARSRPAARDAALKERG